MMASQSGNNDAGSSGQGISSELRVKDLPSERLLGKGLASIVYKTEWNGQRFARKDFIGVPSAAFQKEAAILVGLKDHENVVKTHARTVDKMSCSLVLEYMEEDLLDVLQKRKESLRGASGTASGGRCEGDPSYPFELPEALAILSQIARGMEFLHEQNIPHGDLKTKNILVSHINDGDKNVLSVKVSDFGLVRTKSRSMSFVSRQARKLDVVQWKAPEVLERLLSEDNDVTTSESDSNSDTERTGSLSVSDRLGADVYSFAVTCSQVLTGEGPYPNGNWKELGSKIVSGELRPSLPAECPGLLKWLLRLCWRKSAAERPSFSFIRERLEWLVAEVQGHLSLKEVGEKTKLLDNPRGFHSLTAPSDSLSLRLRTSTDNQLTESKSPENADFFDQTRDEAGRHRERERECLPAVQSDLPAGAGVGRVQARGAGLISQPRMTVTRAKRVQRHVSVPTEMYADRANGEKIRNRSIRDQLGGLSEQVSSVPQSAGTERQKDIEGQWKHDMFFDERDDGPRGQSGRSGLKDLRSKLTRYIPRNSNDGKAGVVDLRDNLLGITSQTPPVTKVHEPSEAQRRVASVVYNNSSTVTHPVASTTAPAPASASARPTPTVKRSSNAMAEEQTVRTLLHSLGLEKYAITFQVEEVDMAALRYMSDNDLKELGVPMGPRKKILLAIRGKEQ